MKECVNIVFRKNKLNNKTIFRAISILDQKSKKRIVLVCLIQTFLSLFDLVAVGLVGVLGALTIRGIKSENPGDRVSKILQYLHISDYKFQTQVALLGLITASLLTLKTILSIYFSKRTLYFLSRKSSSLSSLIFKWYISGSLTELQKKSSQEILYSLTTGVRSITLGIVGSLISVITDFSLLFILFVGLFLVNPSVAIISIAIFSSVGYFLFRTMKAKAQKLGSQFGELSIKGNNKILEVILTYREAVVRNRRKYYADQIEELFSKQSNGMAEMSFMPNISKYVVETTVVISALFICGSQFMISSATQAIGTLSIFLAAGTRIAPAILRIQQSMIVIRGSIGTSEITLNLISELNRYPRIILDNSIDRHTGDLFIPEVCARDLAYTYGNASEFSIDIEKFNISKGSLVAFVGPSGAGKTTLIDMILGVIEPTRGSITISGLNPLNAIKKWPGLIAYVPQDVQIIEGSVRDNIEIGYSPNTFTDLEIVTALNKAELQNVIGSLENGLDSLVGERGARLSGGQRQRLGIARALVSKPKLLVMDEATSALDSETELAISRSLKKLKGEVTIILIAHRLSTVKEADVIFYLEEGKLIANGTFHDVRKAIPNFDRQASLMGL